MFKKRFLKKGELSIKKLKKENIPHKFNLTKS